MSTFDKLKERGISVRDVVRTPPRGTHTIGRITRLYFEYAMVRYPNGITVGYKPELLAKASDDERAGFEAAEQHNQSEGLPE